MMAGSTWNANTTPRLECCFPSSPNTNDDPAYENASRAETASPSFRKMSWPIGILNTKMAKASCSPTPQPTTPNPLIIVVWLSVPTSESG